jgi:DNA-binding NarL/FixJ family response regulator
MGKPRVLLADDHTLVVEALKKLLQPEFEIVGVVPDGRKLLEVAPALKPDVVLIDLGMPKLNGFDAGSQLRKLLPDTRLIVLTVTEDYAVAAETLIEWASGYVLKNSAGSELAMAIRDVLNGKQYLTPKITHRQSESLIRDSGVERVKVLSPRQREVLQLLAEGCSMKEAAAVLEVATRTVAFHKYQIMKMCGLRTNSDLIRFAIKQRLLSPV